MAIGQGTWFSYATPSGTPIINTTDVVLKAATAGVTHKITDLAVYNSHATVSTVVVIKNGSTVVWTGYVPAVNGKIEVNFSVPIECSVNTALNFACITTGSNVYVSATGYTS